MSRTKNPAAQPDHPVTHFRPWLGDRNEERYGGDAVVLLEGHSGERGSDISSCTRVASLHAPAACPWNRSGASWPGADATMRAPSSVLWEHRQPSCGGLHGRRAQRLRKRYRNRVADPSGDPPVWSEELVVIRKRLERGRFAKADGSVLLRMAEPAVRKAVASAGECRSHAIPPHSSVDVAESGRATVAIERQPFRPIPSAAAIHWCGPNSLQVQRRQTSRDVIRDAAVSVACRYRGEPPNAGAHSHPIRSGTPTNWRRQTRLRAARGKQHEAATMLWYVEVTGVENAPIVAVPAIVENPEKATKGTESGHGCDAGDVFHQHGSGHQRNHQARELAEKCPVGTAGQSMPSSLFGKGLARGAAGQEQLPGPNSACQRANVGCGHGVQVRCQESCVGIVPSIGVADQGVYVDADKNVPAGAP